jgi:beta-N-acetylhexosaminidase
VTARPRRARTTTATRLVASAAATVLLAAGCATPSDPTTAPGGSDPSGSGATAQPDGSQDAAVATDPDEPLGWGPTAGELEEARELVATYSSEELAGQVIVGRYAGTDPEVPAQLVRDLHLAGVCVTADNVLDEAQVLATTAAVSDAVAESGRDFPAVIGVDEEGGTVAHLRGVATTFPAFAAAGSAIDNAGRRGRVAVKDAAYATGMELRALGFTWVYAPVADVTIGAADVTIGSRSPSTDPDLAGAAVKQAVTGYDRSGTVSTTKHFPGHGGATADSHLTLPVLTETMAELEARDLPPFEKAIEAGAPSVMIGHLDVQALAPGTPSSIAPETYAYLREELGFGGVAITDSLGMGAVAGIPALAVKALEAGADLLLMPADTRRTHATVTAALEDGTLDRARVEEAAARVVALQRWQARIAAERPVGEDVEEQAAAASAALSAAAYGS